MTAPDRSRISRRQFLPGAAGVLAGGVVGGVVGHEWPRSSQSKQPAEPGPSQSATSAPSTSSGAGPFLSRPDLRPPVVQVSNVSGAALSESSPRFVCLAVDNIDATDTRYQQGVMLLDRQGRVVWFHPTSTKPFDAMVQTYQGAPVLTWWEGTLLNGYGQGHTVVADGQYRTVRTIGGADGVQADLHDCVLTSRGTALLTAYQTTTTDLTSVGGSSGGPVLDGHVLEVELSSGKVLLDWSSLDHVAVSESYSGLPKDKQQPYNYFHLNCVSETEDGNLLISARNTWTVYKVDRTSGKVIWRMGGKRSDFQIASAARFAWQHHVLERPGGLITMFDNSTARTASRGLLLAYDESAKSVTISQQYNNPGRFRAVALGSTQLLPDGNVFVGWGDQPYFSEFAHDGTRLTDGVLPIGVRSYRAFLVDWVGRPQTQPAVVARTNPAGGFAIYVSWNGATEVASWEVLAGRSKSSLTRVAVQEWAGFETRIVAGSGGPYFQVVALDANGNELGRSQIT